jgi:hypothetical protein
MGNCTTSASHAPRPAGKSASLSSGIDQLQFLPPADQRLTSVAIRAETGSDIIGPNACNFAGLPSA